MENEWTKKVKELEAINKALREQNTVLNKRVRESKPVLDRDKVGKIFEELFANVEKSEDCYDEICEHIGKAQDTILELSQVEDTGVINPSEMRHMTKEENKREREYEEKNFETIQVEDTEVIASGKVEISGYDINLSTDKEIFYIDDAEFWEKYLGKEIIISVKEKNE